MPAHSLRHKTYPLLKSGLSPKDVSKKTGVDKGTVFKHARELKLISEERLTPRYDWSEVQKAYDQGVNPYRLKERFHFTDSAWCRAIQTGKIIPDPARQRKRGCKINEDLSGVRYGKLVVIRQVESGSGGRRWLCRCDCGTEKTWTTGALNFEGRQSCGCAHRRKGKQNPKWKGHGEISGGYWSNLEKNANKRNIIFDITIQEAWGLFQKQKGRCAISGVSIVMGARGKQTASVDRIDSDKGYSLDNIQWVHKDVNLMKLDHTTPEFLNWINTISIHQQTLK